MSENERSPVVSHCPYDALLLVSFGGPECKEDVLPFLENVLRGKPVPRERMLEVAEHYYHFDGISPLNEQCRQLIAALEQELKQAGILLPVYWGNRNWHPLLPDTLRQMADDGVKRVLAIFTSAYSSYSGCRQYRENIRDAQLAVGPMAPAIDKVRVFYNHPDFIAANTSSVRAAIEKLPASSQADFHLLFTAHSIPLSMADNCQYVPQLQETCRLIAEELNLPADRWQLVYQSRSGRPQDPWLEPDILQAVRDCQKLQVPGVVIAPVGFLSDHMEVLYDLDDEARRLCEELAMPMTRAATVGIDPRFVRMLRELVEERLRDDKTRRAIGQFPANHDVCPDNCCLYPANRGAAGRPAAATGCRPTSDAGS